jgi:hypothetical protein
VDHFLVVWVFCPIWQTMIVLPCSARSQLVLPGRDLSLSEHRVEASLPNESCGGLQRNHMVKSRQVSRAKDSLNPTLDHLDFEGFQAAFQAPWNLITMMVIHGPKMSKTNPSNPEESRRLPSFSAGSRSIFFQFPSF